jgi:hypothetical protein
MDNLNKREEHTKKKLLKKKIRIKHTHTIPPWQKNIEKRERLPK